MTYTLTGNLGTLIGEALTTPAGTPAKAYLVPYDLSILEGSEVRLGSIPLTLDANSAFTQTGIPEGSYRVEVHYYSAVARQMTTWTTYFFALGTNMDLSLVVDRESDDLTSVIYAYDTFTRADAGTLGTSSSGHAWSILGGTSAAIVSNKAASFTANTSAVLDVGKADVRIEADVKMGGQSGLFARAVDNNNYWAFFRNDLYTYWLLKRVAGGYASVYELRFPGPSDQIRRMGLACYGPNITCLLDGVPIFGCTDSTFSTATKHGIGIFGNGVPTPVGTHTFDNLIIDKVPSLHRRTWVPAIASHDTPQVSALVEHDTLISGFAAITNATAIREHDGILYDPTETNAARRYKFYVSVQRSSGGASTYEVFVMFSADGVTWTTPAACTFAGSLNVEDPSVVTHVDIEQAGTIVRDSAGKIQMYAEHSAGATNDIYGWVSADGVTWTQMPNNPAVPAVGSLQGSPIARWDGTKIILGYEVIMYDAVVSNNVEYFYVATGQAGALVASPNNPVWNPLNDYHADISIVADTMQRDVARGEWVFLAHNGSPGTVTSTSQWRGKTTVMDPTAWTDGDIHTVGGNIRSERSDITLDASDPGRSRVVLITENTGRVYRAYLTGPTD